MRRIRKILQKQFKILWRSKSSLLLIVLVPLIVALLLGLAFHNAQPYTIAVGVFSPSYSAVKNSLIDDLAENFKVSTFHSQTDCLEALRNGRLHVCIFLPDDVSVEEDKSPSLTFYVDNTKTNLVWAISDMLSSRFANSSSKIRYSLTKELVDRVDLTKSELEPFGDTLLLLENNTLAFINATHDIQKRIAYSNISGTVMEADSLFNHSASLEDSLQPYFGLSEELEDFSDTIDFLQSDLGGYNLTSAARADVDDLLDELEDGVADLKASTSDEAQEAQTKMTQLKSNVETINKQVFSTQMTLRSLSQQHDAMLGDFNQNIAQITVLDNHTLTVLQAISTLPVTNVSTIVTPLGKNIKPIVSQQSRFSLIFPTLFVFMVMFSAMLFSSSLIAAEIQHQCLPAKKQPAFGYFLL